MPSEWNMFVKKIYEEGKSKDSNYEFKQALIDASKRKSEMEQPSASGLKSKTAKKSRRKNRGKSKRMSASMAGGKKSRKNRRRH
jgi:hypothetical protein